METDESYPDLFLANPLVSSCSQEEGISVLKGNLMASTPLVGGK
jgi:hypothetical protein